MKTSIKFMNEIETLKKRIEELEGKFNSLSSSTTIPFNVAVAIKARMEQDFVAGDSSAVSASTYTQAVSEAGSGSYNVAKPMTGFIEVIFGGITYNIPYY